MLLVLVLFAARAHACSQCLCGAPFPADVLGGLVPMQFRYGFEERYLSKANGLEDGPGSEREQEHRIAAFALWRPADRLALLARLPYNVKQITETPQGGSSVTQRAQGLGDAEVQALLGFVETAGARRAILGVVLGAELPTGANELHHGGGERLDSHLQPGTGAWTGTAGIHMGMASSRGTFDASVLGRSSGRSSHGYRYGNVLLFNAGYTSPSRGAWALIAQLNGRTAARDRLEDGTLGVNTGGSVLYAAPAVRWQGALGVGLEAGVQLPVLQSLLGDQREHTTARLSISMGR